MKKIDLSEPPRIDYAAEIADRVTMEDVVIQYTGLNPTAHRIPCPFHHGRDRNLALYRSGWKCYVCGEKGDIVGFVRKLTGLDFIGAVRDLNERFRLGLPVDGEGQVDKEAVREAALRAARRERERLDMEEREEDLELLWDAWSACDRTMREASPDSDEYALAAKNIDRIAYQLDHQQEEVWSLNNSPRQVIP